MVVLIDNGHGSKTAGKCSPDKSLLEYKYAREIASMVHRELVELGITAILVTPETTDITLKERCRRINNYCKQYGAVKCLSVSIHCNAAGSDGEWHDARGWSVFVSNNASYNSKVLATKLAEAAGEIGIKVRKATAMQVYWVQNLAICRDTNCPAVLTENMFMDNREDCKWLLSEEGKNAITALHVAGILEYIKYKEG